MADTQTLIHDLETSGRAWLRAALTEADLAKLDAAAELQSKAGQRITATADLAQVLDGHSALGRAIGALRPGAKPVRIIAFNKSKHRNWAVAWHQDRVIAVAAKHDVDGFGNWTQKSGTWHCEPPIDILDQMLFVRIHLDDTDAANGAMQIAVGSHQRGQVAAAQAEQVAGRYPIETCEAKRGDVLILKMLTLHASKPSSAPSERRVFRVDFAAFDLPAPLQWA